jgi:hypothetical protein
MCKCRDHLRKGSDLGRRLRLGHPATCDAQRVKITKHHGSNAVALKGRRGRFAHFGAAFVATAFVERASGAAGFGEATFATG